MYSPQNLTLEVRLTTNGKESTAGIRTQDCLLGNREIFYNAIHFLFTCSIQQPGINARLSLNRKKAVAETDSLSANRQTNKVNR
jgi:hypothetical protein